MKIAFLSAALLTVGCAPRVWVMEESGDRGALGYQLDLSPQEKDEAIRIRIPCERFEIVSDRRVQAGPNKIDSLPVTIQPTARTADALGTQAPNVGQYGVVKNQAYGPTYPTIETENPIDGSFGRLDYKCVGTAQP